MAEGNKTFMGLAVPLFGEAEIKQQTAATDILTITGAGSQSGDFLVCQTATGTENLVISSSGLITSVVGMSVSSLTTTGVIANSALSSSGVEGAIKISVSSTGAIAAGATQANGILIAPSSKATFNAAFAYWSSTAAGALGTTNYLLACHGSKSPTYLLGVGATAVGVGAAASNGFVTAGLFLTAALATTTPMVGLKVQFGDSVFYVMCVAQCGMSA